MNQRIRTCFAAVLLALGVQLPATAADPYPGKPIRVIVPFPPGGGTDVTARLVARRMSEHLGQPITVENRSGADGQVGTQAVLNEPADGYTVLATADAFPLAPALKLKPGYDPVKDFAAIGPMVQGAYVLVVGAEQPYRSAKDIVERARSAKLEFASSASSVRLATESFLKNNGVQMLHIPYRGAAAALPDVVAGRATMMFDSFPSSGPYIQSGKVKVLGVSSSTRMGALPEVPTLKEQGIDFAQQYWLGLFVRAGTPPAVIARISDALRHALADADYITRVRGQGGDPSHMSPQAFGEMVARQTQDAIRLAAELNIAKE